MVKYGLDTTNMFRNNKHIGIETRNTRWFYSSLSNQLNYFLLDNGMISCSCLNTELLEIMEQGMMRPLLKLVTLKHIKHKPIGSNAPPLISKLGKYIQPAQQKKRMMKRLQTVTHQECFPLCSPSS